MFLKKGQDRNVTATEKASCLLNATFKIVSPANDTVLIVDRERIQQVHTLVFVVVLSGLIKSWVWLYFDGPFNTFSLL